MSRQGLKRVGCQHGCGCIAYMTVAQLERFGFPVCPCGAGMLPESFELAAALMTEEELRSHPDWHEFARRVDGAMTGQRSHGRRGHSLRSADAIAAEHVAKARKQEAHARRLSGLVQFTRAAQAAADMPF